MKNSVRELNKVKAPNFEIRGTYYTVSFKKKI